MQTARSEHFTSSLRKHSRECLGEVVTEQNLHETNVAGSDPVTPEGVLARKQARERGSLPAMKHTFSSRIERLCHLFFAESQ